LKLEITPFGHQPVGTKGMPVFVKTLRTDKMDVEIVKVSLEALNILCTPDDDSSKDKVVLSLSLLGVREKLTFWEHACRARTWVSCSQKFTQRYIDALI
jgi:hypothetical protein